MHEQLIAMGYGKNLVPTPTPADALRLLAAGECDYAVVAMVPGMYIIREYKLTNLAPVARSIASQKYGYAVRKGNAELLARLPRGWRFSKRPASTIPFTPMVGGAGAGQADLAGGAQSRSDSGDSAGCRVGRYGALELLVASQGDPTYRLAQLCPGRTALEPAAAGPS